MKSTVKPTADTSPADDGLAPGGDHPVGDGPDLATLAWRNKWLLVAGLIGGVVMGVAAYLTLGPTYQASARILVSKRNAMPLGNGENATYGERGEHVALIMSPLIVEEAVRQSKLDQLPSFALQNKPAAGPGEVAESILDGLKVKRTAGSDQSFLNVLEITYDCAKPRDATAVVDGIINAYRDYLDKTRQDNTAENVAQIRQANDDLLRKLHDTEQQYFEFRKNAPLHWRNAPGTEGAAGDATNIHQERVVAVEADRRLNLLRRTEINAKLKSIELAQQRGDSREALELLVRRFLNVDGGTAGTAPGTTVGGISVLAAMESRLLPLLLEEKKLLRDFGPDHPDVRAVRQSIATTREFYRQQGLAIPDPARPDDKPSATSDEPGLKKLDLIEVYVTSLRQELAELQFRDQELATIFAAEDKAAKEFSRYQLEDQKLNGEVKRTKMLWETVVGRLNEVSLVKDNNGFIVKVVAAPREELARKRQFKIVGGGTVFGLMLALGLAYLKALRDTTLRSTEDVQRCLSTAIIGRIPDVQLASRSPGNSLLSPSLYYFHTPGTPGAEACRSLRSTLFVCTHARGAKVIQVTSPETRDGKTLLAANLAVAIAQSGRKVLLIDADLRCPTLHTLFGLRPEIGLSDVLAGEIDVPNAVHITEVAGLSILGCGLSPTQPAEMLSSPRFQQVLRGVRSEYDFVIVDTPPLLAVTDPCIVSAHTDAVLLVVRLDKSRRDKVRRAQETLTTHGVTLLGVVVNGAEPPQSYGTAYACRAPKENSAPRREEQANAESVATTAG